MKSECSRLLIDSLLFFLIRGFDHSCAAMQLVFGGKADELRPFLLEERIVDGWVPRNAKRFGITLGEFSVASSNLNIAFHTKTVPPTISVVSPHIANDDHK